eukprot:scaffold100569_cov48-Phaeocystis_antarctica.AAC.3
MSKTSPVRPTRREPSGRLAEAGRSLGQPGACSDAGSSLWRASWPKAEPVCCRHRYFAQIEPVPGAVTAMTEL